MAQTVIGFFDEASEAQKAVEKLQSRGISRDRIDVSRGSGSSTAGAGYSNTSGSSDRVTDDDRTVDREGRNTNAITDFFNSLFGGKDDDAERYSRVASSSNTIVTVHAQTEDEAEAAADIMDDCGAIDVDERSAQYGYDSSRGSSDRMGDRTGVSSDRDTTIERMEENLEIGKRTVETGGVRVRSRIVENPVEEHIRLREEHVNVERTPVDRAATSADMDRAQDREIEMRESAEVPVVNKEARVVEEIRISKDVDERDETIRENVRHTEVDVDNDIDRNNINKDRTDRDTDLNRTDRDTHLNRDRNSDNSRDLL